MGAAQFSVFRRASPPLAASDPWSQADALFQRAVDDARHEEGHGGYTGTIAEKDSFVQAGVAAHRAEAQGMMDALWDNEDYTDKWGPAGALAILAEGDHPGGYLFFGYASE